MSWTITPLLLGYLRHRPKDHITYGRGAGETVDLACYGWLLRDAGTEILVDTGPCSTEHGAAFHGVDVERDDDHDLRRALQAQGVDPDALESVVITHLHWDHCYGLDQVPGAAVFVQDREIRYAVYPRSGDDRRKYEFPAGAPFLPHLRRMHAVDGGLEIVPGVRIVPTPGHSPGHQSVVVDAEHTRYLVAGDFIDLYENWDDRVPSGSGLDVDAWQQSYDAARALGIDAVLPSHDPRVLDHEVYR